VVQKFLDFDKVKNIAFAFAHLQNRKLHSHHLFGEYKT